MKETLTPLSICKIRSHYWDRNNNKGKPIKVYIGQDKEHLEQLEFTPGGTLVHKWGKMVYPPSIGPINHQYTEYIENWLSTSTSGPYSRTGASNDYYYLSGTENRGGNMSYVEYQICSKPINTLSMDCMDNIGVYVKKSI